MTEREDTNKEVLEQRSDSPRRVMPPRASTTGARQLFKDVHELDKQIANELRRPANAEKSDKSWQKRQDVFNPDTGQTKKEDKKPVIEIKDEKSIEKACQSSAEVKADEKTETEIKTLAKASPRTGTKRADAAKQAPALSGLIKADRGFE